MKQLNAFILIGLVLLAIPAMFIIFSTPPAPDNAPWEDQGPEWYYYNLNATQRQKIRQAMDHCVPRQEIINGLHLGFAEAIASPIGVNFLGVYEETIEARSYNTTIAAGLLEEVFGYTYATDAGGTNKTSKETDEPYFKITLICPTTNAARSQWAALISFSLNQVGIDAKLIWWNWDIIKPRLFLDPVGTGYNYENGGYDVFFGGYDTSPDPTYKEYYDKDTFPPSSNCYWIEDGPATSGTYTSVYPNITALWTDIYKEMDYATRVEMLKEYQQWCYDQVPTCIIPQEIQLWALDADLTGFDDFHGIQQMISNWTIGSQTVCTIAQPGNYADFNPQLSNSYYDALIFTNTHVQLARRRGNYNISHAYPWLAENWTHSTDYLTYTVNIRQGNYWSDGEIIDADDVIFTYHAILNDSTGSPGRGTLMNIIGDATGTDGKFDCVKKGANDYQVIFTLPEPYAYVETVLFSGEILPEHQMGLIALDTWGDHGTNTGATPIIASGPYVMKEYDSPSTVELEVNTYYNQESMGHDIGLGANQSNWLPNATELTQIFFKVVGSGIVAVLDLIAETYDVIDSQMGIQAMADVVNTSSLTQLLTSYEWGYQEMAFNHYNPIFGMNPHDPDIWYKNNNPIAHEVFSGLENWFPFFTGAYIVFIFIFVITLQKIGSQLEWKSLWNSLHSFSSYSSPFNLIILFL